MAEDRIIESGARALGIALLPHQRAALGRYLDLVLRWSGRLRLTGARTRDAAARVLVVDGLDAVPFLPEAGAIADLGSGAGVPGILAAVLRPPAHVVLVEPSHKKAGFLEIAVRELALPNVEVVCARAEALGRSPAHRGRYDAVTARALAGLPVLVEYALPLLRVGGLGVFPKGRTAFAEVDSAARVLGLLRGEARLEPSGRGQGRTVILVRKLAPTPEKYPRRVGVAQRSSVR